jgi:hypothetical protein
MKLGNKHKETKMEHTLDYKNPPKYIVYKNRHIQKFGNSNYITKSEFESISLKDCVYCGKEGPNGIDRIDSNIGYEIDNCAPCCKHCNYVKGNLPMELFKEWTKRFVNFQNNT